MVSMARMDGMSQSAPSANVGYLVLQEECRFFHLHAQLPNLLLWAGMLTPLDVLQRS